MIGTGAPSLQKIARQENPEFQKMQTEARWPEKIETLA
jgi:hypothetical protein